MMYYMSSNRSPIVDSEIGPISMREHRFYLDCRSRAWPCVIVRPGSGRLYNVQWSARSALSRFRFNDCDEFRQLFWQMLADAIPTHAARVQPGADGEITGLEESEARALAARICYLMSNFLV